MYFQFQLPFFYNFIFVCENIQYRILVFEITSNLYFEFHNPKQRVGTFTRKSRSIYHLYLHDGSNVVINRYPSKYLIHYIRILFMAIHTMRLL